MATLLLLGLHSGILRGEEGSLARLLESAARVHVTAPWEESDAILDRVEPLLEEASEEQLAHYLIMRARNVGLAGNLRAGLDKIPRILSLDISQGRRLRVLSLGANLAMLLRQYELAFDYLNRALALEPEVFSPEKRVILFNQAAQMHIEVGELDRARAYGERAMQLAAEADDTRVRCTSAYRLAYVEKVAENFESAEQAHRDAIALCKAANDPVFIASAKFHLADTLRQSGRYEESDQYFQQAFEGHQDSLYATGLAQVRAAWARLNLERGRIEDAEQLLDGLDEELIRQSRWELLAEYHQMRSEIARSRGDYRQSLEHQDAYIQARERFLDHDRAMRLAYLEVEFDSKVKEQELALLREQAQVAELQKETRRHQQRFRALGYLSGTFVLLVLVLFLFHALRERRHYRKLSVRDGLTGLLNHTRFFDAAQPHISEAAQKGTPLTLVLADIDFFKQINDRYGHLVGDEVLRRVARCFDDVLDGDGPVGRIGGEEFAACLPHTTLDQALTRVEKLRQALTEVDLGKVDEPITISFGIAELRPQEGLESIRSRADNALYEAKNEGRDRIVLADPRPGPNAAS